jgi:hypothetical protein
LGILISGLLSRKRDEIAVGFWMIFGSLVGFGIFGSFLGGSPIIGWLWPVLVILLGLILLVGGLFRRR